MWSIGYRADTNRRGDVMPRYEFRCEECLAYQETQIHFEVGPECPVCYRTMKRVWSAPGVQFKGSGFYKTDNQS